MIRKALSLTVAGIFTALLATGCIAASDESFEDLEDTESNENALALPPTLPVGMGGTTGSEIFGRGPTYTNGQWTEANPYTMVLGRISPNELPEYIEEARQKNILLVLNMAGSRNQWTVKKTVNGKACLMYDPAKYRARIDEYVGVPGLKQAIDDRRVVAYVVDEPNIAAFCGSITPAEANAMGLYVKQKFPHAITIIRTSAEVLKNGFSGQGPLPNGFWTGFDYGWGLYKGWMKDKLGKTAKQWYPEEKARMASMNMGMIYGLNILNHGSFDCWDYKNDGQSWGRVRGQDQALVGGIPCNQDIGKENNWMASPAFVKSVVDVAVADPDAPFLAMWTHITPEADYQEFKQYEVRSDFVAAYKYMIAKGKQRTQWNGWRAAK